MKTQQYIAQKIRDEGARRYNPTEHNPSDYTQEQVSGFLDAADFVEKLDLGNFRPSED